jgi:hypothetical protein
MGKTMICMHALRLFADRYEQWKRAFPHDSEEGLEIMVPVKHLRIAHEIVEEEKPKKEK